MADDPTDIDKERRMIEPEHGARPMAAVIVLADHRPPYSARMPSTDPLVVALAALPRTAGLATRTRALIEAGASDVFVDGYIAASIDYAAKADLAHRASFLSAAKASTSLLAGNPGTASSIFGDPTQIGGLD